MQTKTQETIIKTGVLGVNTQTQTNKVIISNRKDENYIFVGGQNVEYNKTLKLFVPQGTTVIR